VAKTADRDDQAIAETINGLGRRGGLVHSLHVATKDAHGNL
jgi:hypothetical protein